MQNSFKPKQLGLGSVMILALFLVGLGGCGMGPQLRFRFVLPPGYTGTVLVIEDPGLPVDYNRIYTLTVKNGVVLVPKGFCADPPTLEYVVVEVVDSNGKVLSRGDLPPDHEIGLRSYFAYAYGHAPLRYYFHIGTKYHRYPLPK